MILLRNREKYKMKSLVYSMVSVLLLTFFLRSPSFASPDETKRDLIVEGFAEAVCNPNVEIAVIRVLNQRKKELPPEFSSKDKEIWAAYIQEIKPPMFKENRDGSRPEILFSVKDSIRFLRIMEVMVDPLFDFEKPFLAFYYRDFRVSYSLFPRHYDALWLVAYYRPGQDDLMKTMKEFSEEVNLEQGFYNGLINENNYIKIMRKSDVVVEDLVKQYEVAGFIAASLEFPQEEYLSSDYIDLSDVREIVIEDFRKIVSVYKMSKGYFEGSDPKYREFFVKTLQTEFAKEVAREVFEVPGITE